MFSKKMNFQAYSLLVLSLVCLHLRSTFAGKDGHECFEKVTAEDKKAMMAVMETCKKKLGLTDFPKPDEVEKNGFDDKCFAKCKLTEMKLINDKGMVDEKMLETFLKKVPADKQADVSNLWKTCGDSIKKTMEAEGGINEKNSCKAAAMLKHCFMEGVKKMC